jgi:hypothetical protein
MIGGVKAEEFDYFHELVAMEETYAIGFPGVSDGNLINHFLALGGGLGIGLPPVVKFGSK